MTYTVEEIAAALSAKAEGAVSHQISGPAEPQDAREDQLALAMNEKFAEAISQGSAKAAILWEGADWRALGLEAAIFVPRPRYALANLTSLFEKKPHAPATIHPTAHIDDDVIIGANAAIGPFVYIARGARIGANARILSHVSISENAIIGENVLLHNGVRIGARVEIGDDFIAQANANIGPDGFSFVTPQPGAIEEARQMTQVSIHDNPAEFSRINSLGTVIVGDRVEVGANSTIDRGTIANTKIENGTKIDNLVQIGHNCHIGKNCLLCGQVGLAGSVTLGDGVILAGKVGVADHVNIGHNVVVGVASTVVSNVPSNRTMMGTPAVKMESNLDIYKALRRLPRLALKVEALQKQVSKFDDSE